MDKFDSIPDDIMLKFISYLGMRSAAQTSIISKRWRYLPTYLADLDFDPRFIGADGLEWYSFTNPEKKGYVDWVNQVISMHRGDTIERFRVLFRGGGYETSFDEWVKFAISKKVKDLFLYLDVPSRPYSLGVDVFSHPSCRSGIGFLKSLHLLRVKVDGECLELFLDRCRLLERLHVEGTSDLVTLKVNHSKLQFLTIGFCQNLKELEVHSSSLVYFEYRNACRYKFPKMVFKSIPALVEANFTLFTWFSPVFQHLSGYSSQLSKLILRLDLDIIDLLPRSLPDNLDDLCQFIRDVHKVPAGAIIPTFPNVKSLELSIDCEPYYCINYLERFIEACPALQQFTLMINWRCLYFGEEAKELLEVEAPEAEMVNVEEADKPMRMCGNLEFEAEILKEEPGTAVQVPQNVVSHDCRTRPNLSIFQLVGFRGCRLDVQFTLYILETFPTKTVIFDPRASKLYGRLGLETSDCAEEMNISRRRARKLARILEPKTMVVIA